MTSAMYTLGLRLFVFVATLLLWQMQTRMSAVHKTPAAPNLFTGKSFDLSRTMRLAEHGHDSHTADQLLTSTRSLALDVAIPGRHSATSRLAVTSAARAVVIHKRAWRDTRIDLTDPERIKAGEKAWLEERLRERVCSTEVAFDMDDVCIRRRPRIWHRLCGMRGKRQMDAEQAPAADDRGRPSSSARTSAHTFELSREQQELVMECPIGTRCVQFDLAGRQIGDDVFDLSDTAVEAPQDLEPAQRRRIRCIDPNDFKPEAKDKGKGKFEPDSLLEPDWMREADRDDTNGASSSNGDRYPAGVPLRPDGYPVYASDAFFLDSTFGWKFLNNPSILNRK